MTRGEMLAHVRANLMLEDGDALSRWAGPPEERALDAAADDIAQRTDCYYTEMSDALVAGQATYCYPKIYKLKAVYCVDAQGERHRLPLVTANYLEKSGRGGTLYSAGKSGWAPVEVPGWRTWPAEDTPRFAVLADLTTFDVAPVAKTTRAGGIIAAGFALPSLPANGHALHQWDTAGDECPLPAVAHEAVIALATARRCLQMSAKDRNYIALAQAYKAEAAETAGRVGVWAAKNYAR